MDLKNNNISKMKYQSIYIVIALTFMFATQVFGQSSNIKNDTMVLQTRINLINTYILFPNTSSGIK